MQVKSLCQTARQQIGIIYRKFMVILTVLHYWHMYMTSSGECSTSLGSLSEEAHQLTRISTKFCTQGLHKELGYGLYCGLLSSCNLPTLASRSIYLKLCFYIRSFMVISSFILKRFHIFEPVSTSFPFLLFRMQTCLETEPFHHFPSFLKGTVLSICVNFVTLLISVT